MALDPQEAEIAENLLSSKQACEILASRLPRAIDFRQLAPYNIGPYYALALRAGLAYRQEEVVRNAAGALLRMEKSVGILLTRASIENAALGWSLLKNLRMRPTLTSEALDKKLRQLWGGSKRTDNILAMPEPVNVLTLVSGLDKKCPGIRLLYDELSEVAHPNYSGVHGMYAHSVDEDKATYFGKAIGGDGHRLLASKALVVSSRVFLTVFDEIEIIAMEWSSNLDPLKSSLLSGGFAARRREIF